MNLNDELLAHLKNALDDLTKMKRKGGMTKDQILARGCVVADVMNAFAHAHNLIISLESDKGISPFWSVPYPKQVKLPKRPDNTDGVSIAKLEIKLKRLAEQLEKTDSEEQSALDFYGG